MTKHWTRLLVIGAAFTQPVLSEVPQPQLLSIRLIPQQTELRGEGATQRFVVLGQYDYGLERDLTEQSRFVVSAPSLLRVENDGLVTAQSDGTTILTATLKGLSASARVRVQNSGQKPPFSFAWEIGSILTRHGCNDSHCHGGVKGRGGFKLSLDALYPKDDYEWIVQGGTYQVLSPDPGVQTPRIDRSQPENSSLLRKASLATPHAGGRLLPKDSSDYFVILDWVKRGAPYEDRSPFRSPIVRIEVNPGEAVLDPEGKRQLLVTAHRADGSREDITQRVRYVSNNSEVAEVTSQGKVTAVRPGETSVTIRAAGHNVSARIGVLSKSLRRTTPAASNNFIDERVFDKLRRFHLIPSQLSSDGEFLRRVCLDLTGTLPPPERTREFLADPDRGKREKLIEILLDTPEYVDYWTFRFAQLFRVALFQNGINLRWSEAYWEWIRTQIRTNTPYDRVARERIAAIGSSPASRHFLPNGEVRYPQNKMGEQVRVFMGRRLDCAECHNHPFEAWSQDQFWGLAAFFGRMNLIGGRGEEPGTVIYEDPTGQEIDLFVVDKSRKVLHPRTKKEVWPAFPDGTRLSEPELEDPRLKLAEWVTAHPYFAEATANRMWAYFLGRGLVEPVDDFRSDNPPTHPGLLQDLARHFLASGYDLKELIRVIVNSRTYQLSSRPNPNNRQDRFNYSHSLPRVLEAEVLLDAIAAVTGMPLLFRQDSYGEGLGTLPPGTRAIQVKIPDVFQSRVLNIYGQGNRSMLPEGRPIPNLRRALHSLAGSTFTDNISHPQGRLSGLIESGASTAQIIEELYLHTLTRYPTREEQSSLGKSIASRVSRREGLQDLLWGLLNSPEFYHNH